MAYKIMLSRTVCFQVNLKPAFVVSDFSKTAKQLRHHTPLILSSIEHSTSDFQIVISLKQRTIGPEAHLESINPRHSRNFKADCTTSNVFDI